MVWDFFANALLMIYYKLVYSNQSGGPNIVGGRIFNLIKLIQLFRERGNWPLIRRSRKQLLDFILCYKGLNNRPFLKVIPYWFYMLKSLDALVWRLETFGFLYPANASEMDKQGLNRYLQS